MTRFAVIKKKGKKKEIFAYVNRMNNVLHKNPDHYHAVSHKR